jgi:hypothetical protein
MSSNPDRRAAIFGNVLTLRLLLTTISMIIAVIVAYLIPKYATTHIPLGIAIASATTYLTLIGHSAAEKIKIQWAA